MPGSASVGIQVDAHGAAALAQPSTVADKVTAAFEAFRIPVYRYLLVVTGSPAEAEDSTQECFLRLHRQLCQGATIRNEQLWLFTVAHNVAMDRRKGSRFERSFDAPDWTEVIENRSGPEPNPEQTLIQKERYLALRQAVDSLSAIEQQVLHLRSEGLRYREIADVMGIGTSTVFDALNRGIAKLKAGLNA